MVRRQLAQALGVGASPDRLVRFRDQRTELQYLRPTTELAERGLFVELGAYQANVMLDWREVDASDGWGALMHQLSGRGVPDLDDEWRQLVYRPITDAWAVVRRAFAAEVGEPPPTRP